MKKLIGLFLVAFFVLGVASVGLVNAQNETTPVASTDSVSAQDSPIVVGSKDFVEQQFLGYIIYVALEANGFEVEDQISLGGTAIARGALENGEIDVYPNYTATAALQSLPALGIEVPEGVAKDAYTSYTVVSSLDAAYNDLIWLRPAPANNTYTVAVTREFSEENDITSFSDLADYINDGNTVRMISNEEFTTREDALVTFEETYGFEIPRESCADTDGSCIESLPGAVTASAQQQLRADEGSYNVSVAYGTDGTLAALDLVVLEDPDGAQPVYQPTPVFRGEVLRANPEIADILNPIFATFDVATLQNWNSQAALGGEGGESVEDVARRYLQENGFIE
ncbi:MAG: ABC transporter substrate-binding protein [Chloroflexi bacterium]|nr:ABC transporter substrate-binding protein [Chloroflexota bacterium]